MYGINMSKKENRQKAREIYLKGFEVHEYPEYDCVIGTKAESKPVAIAFAGTAGKPTWHYSFRSVERMEEHIAKFLESQKRQIAYKAEQKENNKGKLTGAAACAAAIRQELKEKYPGIKFSVTSDTFSMGNSVSVNWTDGPEYEEIESIVEGYQYGHFNGMEDIYEYKKDRDDSKPSAKYTHTNKHFSEAGIQALKERAEELGVLYRCQNERGEFSPQLAERIIREELQEREEAELQALELQDIEEPEQEASNVIFVDFHSRKAV
jgi:hypothetical protein